MSDHIDMLP